MKTIFFMPMIPPTVTAQEKNLTTIHGKPFMYDSVEIKNAKQKFKAHLMKHKPAQPYTSAIQLVVKWCFPIKGKHADGEYKTSKPDTDNLQKLLKDCMTKTGFWKDDALVCSEICQKFWAKIPGIFICVEELPKNGYSES